MVLYAKPSLLVLRAFTPRLRLGRSQMTMKLNSRLTIACRNKTRFMLQYGTVVYCTLLFILVTMLHRLPVAPVMC